MSPHNLYMLPELRGLSPATAAGLVRACKASQLRRPPAILMEFVLALVGPLTILGVTGLLMHASTRQAYTTTVVTLVTIYCVMTYLGYRVYYRKVLRRFVRETWRDGRPPECYACEYDLRGSSGKSCPECGESIPSLDDVLVD